ncbi:hypothetical protein HDU76_000575 [Blyttiomyces sp. JEL0837]|nr:hypothetical protein HDU76_000575 [Blyttiomyces sp. JEL0837]
MTDRGRLTHGGDFQSDRASVASSEQTEDAELGTDFDDPAELERIIFTAINDGDRETLQDLFKSHPSPTSILQLLLTTTYPNTDDFYKHDPDVISDAQELLGASLEHLNAIQIACILGDEEIALDILDFVTTITEEIQARKVLYEFMGRVWGNGNTVLHLASFLGMSDLVRKLLEMGANPNKKNERMYKPVDCADDDETRIIFGTVTEVPRSPLHPQTDEKELLSAATTITRSGSIRESRSIENFLGAPSRTLTHNMEQLKSGLGSGKSLSASLPTLNDLGNSQSSTSQLSKHGKSSSLDEGNRVGIGLGMPSSSSVTNERGMKRSTSMRCSPTKTSIGDVDTTTKRLSDSHSHAQQSRQDDGCTSISKPVIPKFLKRVTFDPATCLLYMCQHGDPNDQVSYTTIRGILGLSTTTSQEPILPNPQQQPASPNVKLNINQVYSPHQWLTPLHLASTYGHTTLVEILLRETGAAVNVRDREGWSPLHCACAEGHVDIIKLLGRAQGWVNENGERDGPISDEEGGEWFYPPDGPIDLVGLNDDGDTPMDVANDGKAVEIQRIMKDLIAKFPPPQHDANEPEEIGEIEEEEDEEEEEEDEVEADDAIKPINTQHHQQQTMLKRSGTIPKSALRKGHSSGSGSELSVGNVPAVDAVLKTQESNTFSISDSISIPASVTAAVAIIPEPALALETNRIFANEKDMMKLRAGSLDALKDSGVSGGIALGNATSDDTVANSSSVVDIRAEILQSPIIVQDVRVDMETPVVQEAWTKGLVNDVIQSEGLSHGKEFSFDQEGANVEAKLEQKSTPVDSNASVAGGRLSVADQGVKVVEAPPEVTPEPGSAARLIAAFNMRAMDSKPPSLRSSVVSTTASIASVQRDVSNIPAPARIISTAERLEMMSKQQESNMSLKSQPSQPLLHAAPTPTPLPPPKQTSRANLSNSTDATSSPRFSASLSISNLSTGGTNTHSVSSPSRKEETAKKSRAHRLSETTSGHFALWMSESIPTLNETSTINSSGESNTNVSASVGSMNVTGTESSGVKSPRSSRRMSRDVGEWGQSISKAGRRTSMVTLNKGPSSSTITSTTPSSSVPSSSIMRTSTTGKSGSVAGHSFSPSFKAIAKSVDELNSKSDGETKTPLRNQQQTQSTSLLGKPLVAVPQSAHVHRQISSATSAKSPARPTISSSSSSSSSSTTCTTGNVGRINSVVKTFTKRVEAVVPVNTPSKVITSASPRTSTPIVSSSSSKVNPFISTTNTASATATTATQRFQVDQARNELANAATGGQTMQSHTSKQINNPPKYTTTTSTTRRPISPNVLQPSTSTSTSSHLQPSLPPSRDKLTANVTGSPSLSTSTSTSSISSAFGIKIGKSRSGSTEVLKNAPSGSEKGGEKEKDKEKRNSGAFSGLQSLFSGGKTSHK